MVAGRYTLLAELGRGGMGVVWRAEDTVIGRQVAIKELRLPDGAEATVFTERVLREVRAGGRLNDPAVVTVYDVVAEQGATFMVMELVEAPTLAELVRAQGPLSLPQVASIGQQVLSALQAAHHAGIVHRDVKPGNIMVAAGGRVKLTDFGIAQAIDDPRLTTSGMIIGSPAFMAPERVAGKDAVPASDLWSLGATLFFAAEGIMAFERPTTAATLHAIMNEVPYLTRVQGPLASVIMGLLIATPEARISAAQAQGLLGMAATPSGQPVPPHGGTARYPGTAPTSVLPPRQKRKGPLIGAAIAAVLVLACGFLLGDWWAKPATDPAKGATLHFGQGGDITIGSDLYLTEPGICLIGQLSSGQNLGGPNKVACDKSHNIEIYDEYSALSANNDSDARQAGYPAQADLDSFAEARCAMSFHAYLTSAADHNALTYQALVPNTTQWQVQAASATGTRNVYCALTRRDGGPLSSAMRPDLK